MALQGLVTSEKEWNAVKLLCFLIRTPPIVLPAEAEFFQCPFLKAFI